MKSNAVTEFKARCLALLEDVARTGELVLATKRGKPLARIVPSGEEKDRYPQDGLAGTVTIVGDVISPVLPASAWSALRSELLPPAKRKERRTRR